MNVNDNYTIHNIVNSGVYDYLTVSVEAKLNYTDDVNEKYPATLHLSLAISSMRLSRRPAAWE